MSPPFVAPFSSTHVLSCCGPAQMGRIVLWVWCREKGAVSLGELSFGSSGPGDHAGDIRGVHCAASVMAVALSPPRSGVDPPLHGVSSVVLCFWGRFPRHALWLGLGGPAQRLAGQSLCVPCSPFPFPDLSHVCSSLSSLPIQCLIFTLPRIGRRGGCVCLASRGVGSNGPCLWCRAVQGCDWWAWLADVLGVVVSGLCAVPLLTLVCLS